MGDQKTIIDNELMKELKRKGQAYHPEDCCAEHEGADYVMILRCYAPTNPGKRHLVHDLHVISPQKDLGLDLNPIEKDARERYRIS